MKRFVACLVVLATLMCLSTGCDKLLQPKDTTYTFHDNIGEYQMWADEFNPSAWSILVEYQFLEYYERNRINVQTLRNTEKGKTYTFTADSRSEYVTVLKHTKVQSLQYSNLKKEYSDYAAIVYYLKPGDNIDIVFDGNTMLSSSEPIK